MKRLTITHKKSRFLDENLLRKFVKYKVVLRYFFFDARCTPYAAPAISRNPKPASIGAAGVEPPGFGGIGGANITEGAKSSSVISKYFDNFSLIWVHFRVEYLTNVKAIDASKWHC